LNEKKPDGVSIKLSFSQASSPFEPRQFLYKFNMSVSFTERLALLSGARLSLPIEAEDDYDGTFR